MGSRHFF